MEAKSTSAATYKHVAIKLKELYESHDYEIKPDNFDKLVNQLATVIRPQEVDEFFECVSAGEFGTLYKMPTCLMAMAQKFKEECRKPNHCKPFDMSMYKK